MGRTGHESSVAIYGGFASFRGTPEDSARDLELALAAGVNHIDVAPSYGHAEENLGPSLARLRSKFFLACKTEHRTRDDARRELERSLQRLQVEQFDLYQFHAVIDDGQLDAIFAPGGALEAVLQAREEGLTRFIGITGHFRQVPTVFNTALERLDLDTVMLPVNGALWALPDYRSAAERLLKTCAERDLGVMAIKAAARGYWPRAPSPPGRHGMSH